MSCDDKEEQELEVVALTSIYEDNDQLLFAQEGQEPGGVFMAAQTPSQPFYVCVGKPGDSGDPDEAGKGAELIKVSHLPPITLNFVFSWEYPSRDSPLYTLSCPWLSRQQLSKLCHRLDEIWEENRGSVILFQWFQFLQDEALDYLLISSPLDLSTLVAHGKDLLYRKKPCDNKQGDDTEASCLTNKPQGSETPTSSPSKVKEADTDSAYSSQEYSPCTVPTWDFSKNVSSHSSACDLRAVQDCVSVSQLLNSLLDYDKKKEQEVFERSSVQCGVCFTERVGRYCMRFLDCGHAYCKDCLREYFSVQIKDGNVKALNCPDPGCESQAYPYQVKDLVTEEEYERYDKLLLQCTLEMMADVVYCPRRHCQTPVIKEANSNMGRCGNCNYTFCTLCTLSYHGPTPCRIKSEEIRKLREQYLAGNEETRQFLERRYGKRAINQALEESYSAEWLEKNAKMCPYCGTNIQKTDGCNKMTCTKCRSYFCWLCNALLSRSNPYGHFNTAGGACYAKLFEGVDIDEEFFEGDEDDFFDDDFNF